MRMWEVEEAVAAQGFSAICGADEAGAGPLAGRVYAAAVMLPFGIEIPGVDDSKKLSEKKRKALFDVILERATAYSVQWVEAEEIDQTDILSARMKAMDRAIQALDPPADFALIDGNRDKGKSWAIRAPHRCVIKGDGKSLNIAAASILAKVSRDRYMLEMDARYPQYEFRQHKGYPTPRHYALLEEYGPSPIHRRTFLKNR